MSGWKTLGKVKVKHSSSHGTEREELVSLGGEEKNSCLEKRKATTLAS